MKTINYFGDSRYEKIWEQMQLLGIQDVSTRTQAKNGTIIWRLPILSDRKGKYYGVRFVCKRLRKKSRC